MNIFLSSIWTYIYFFRYFFIIIWDIQICEPQTYEMRVITFYVDSTTAVSPAGLTMVGAKGLENFWLFEPSKLLETVIFS